jgi:phosphoserine phosphatase
MKKKNILAIDMDGTLFHANIVVEYGKWLFRKKQIGFFKIIILAFLWLLYHSYLISFLLFSKLTYRLILSSQSKEELLKHFDKFLMRKKNELENITVLNKLRDAQNSNSITILVTRSPKFLAKVVADIYKITYCFGTEFKIRNSTILVDEMFGEKKLASVRTIMKKYKINQSNISAISDNKDDLVLLKNVANGYLIKNGQLHIVS